MSGDPSFRFENGYIADPSNINSSGVNPFIVDPADTPVDWDVALGMVLSPAPLREVLSDLFAFLASHLHIVGMTIEQTDSELPFPLRWGTTQPDRSQDTSMTTGTLDTGSTRATVLSTFSIPFRSHSPRPESAYPQTGGTHTAHVRPRMSGVGEVDGVGIDGAVRFFYHSSSVDCNAHPLIPAQAVAMYRGDIPLPDSFVPRIQNIVRCMGVRLQNEVLKIRSAKTEATATRRVRELAAIYEIGEALVPTDSDQFLQMLVERTAHVMEAQACSIMLVDRQQGRLTIAASYGLPPDIRAQTPLLEEGVAGRVVESERPLLIAKSVEPDPRLDGISMRAVVGSAVLAPMKSPGGQVIGVLSIRRRPERPEFTQADVRLLGIFALHVSLALANSHLVKDLDRRAAELQKLSSLSRTLLSTMDLDVLLTTAVEKACELLGCDRCCLYWRDTTRPVLVPLRWYGYPDSIGRNPVKLGEGAVGLAARTCEVIHFQSHIPVSAEEAQSQRYRQLKGFARSLGIDGFIAIPVMTGNQTCIGVFVADNKVQRTPISAEQRRLLEAFVSQAGIAMENALLYVQTQDSVTNLRRLKEYTDNVLQSIEAAILTTDGRGHVVRCNRACEELLSCSERTIGDSSLASAFKKLAVPPDEESRLLSLAMHVLETGKPVHRLKLTLHPATRGPMTLYLMISRLPDHRTPRDSSTRSDRSGLVIIFEDVTQEVRLEAELEKMRRLADIGQLAAKMAHEVRNALSPIKGAAQIIRSEMASWHTETPDAEEGNLSDVALEWPEMIIAEVDGLSRLTSEMLDFARPTTLSPRPVDLNTFLHTAVQMLQAFLREHRTRLRWKLAPGIPTIEVDAIQMGQVVRNLVMNGAQSMSDGGVLTISSGLTSHDMDGKSEAGLLSTANPHGMVWFEIEDGGVGIPEKDIERIFRPFVTTRPKGTGLGLPIVQKIVNHHHGRVEVKSEVGTGTAFRVILPIRYVSEVDQDGDDASTFFEMDGEGFDGQHRKSGREVAEPPLIYDRPTGTFPDN